jgi:hypothetical protein
VSRVSQFLQLWWLRFWYGNEGDTYYQLRLYEQGQSRRSHALVREREMGRIVQLVNDADPARGREMIGDKQRTEAWCAEHRLPTATTLITVQNGDLLGGTADSLPDCDLFSKLAQAYGGTGARRWLSVAPGLWIASDDPSRTPRDRDGIIAVSRQQSRATGMAVLLQRVLRNHPDVAQLTNGALATIRFVTIRAVSGTVSPVSATYRIPTGDAVVDAFSHGGLAAPVDLATGRLGAAVDVKMAIRGESVAVHPDTGARITDSVLPDWAATVALVVAAHPAVPGMVPLVGWDVALTPEGPLLIEGNVPPSAALMQVPSRTPVGETPIVPCLLEYLRALSTE